MLDAFDLRILALLQEDARISMPDLAARVGLSAPACYRRARALREQGAIAREVALVPPSTMGWPVTMIVLVTLERDRGRIVEEIVTRLQRAPEVMDVWYVTGDHDLVLHVAARDMASYDAFTHRVLHADEHVRNFKTQVVMRQAKRAGALPPAGSIAN
ncbi:MAG TPA: Lrp/AsnC family transcriptional regulator [Sphingobium sp.]|uniref:Lrp/AsnC family transcriptional regulator n=1 Tax=Sphingobium sp. TaxID=1912891 RepID=UPI002ED215DD